MVPVPVHASAAHALATIVITASQSGIVRSVTMAAGDVVREGYPMVIRPQRTAGIVQMLVQKKDLQMLDYGGGNGRMAYLAAWAYVRKKGGTDAQARVTIRLEESGKLVDGQGADTDTIVAAEIGRAHV